MNFYEKDAVMSAPGTPCRAVYPGIHRGAGKKRLLHPRPAGGSGGVRPHQRLRRRRGIRRRGEERPEALHSPLRVYGDAGKGQGRGDRCDPVYQAGPLVP